MRRLPVASGLNSAWVASKKSKNGVMNLESMDDRVALSTRPDFPPSPNTFNREAATTQLSKANQHNPLRKNLVSCVNKCYTLYLLYIRLTDQFLQLAAPHQENVKTLPHLLLLRRVPFLIRAFSSEALRSIKKHSADVMIQMTHPHFVRMSVLSISPPPLLPLARMGKRRSQ
jgi:hypothetical protein